MNPEAVSIRKAGVADSEAIFDIHVDSVTVLCAAHYTKDQISNWFIGRSPADYGPAIEYGAVWIARLDEVPVGFAEVFRGVISMIFVRSAAAAQGIGTRLVNFALERAKEDGGSIVRLEATTNAEGFYHRFGFRTVGKSRLVRASGIELETVLMAHDHP